jgi:catechol 2,3-dioxygenase-like lactoylglutathione lyase family enzyme
MNLNQITLPVTDVERSIGFYRKLGLQLIVKALPHYPRFEFPEENAIFSKSFDLLPARALSTPLLYNQ